jgi:hypothetical protein
MIQMKLLDGTVFYNLYPRDSLFGEALSSKIPPLFRDMGGEVSTVRM